MPTPVSAARQCLTDEAARALDDAVSIARRRNHSQTTSLHAVSALLSLPSSALRDACLRARSTAAACSPRLQLRALDLSVGVSLDRLPTSKSAAESPAVANSLMAAIKRSQANQRRHPDTYQLYQQLQSQNQSANSCVKVEMKQFILSILDDPIVSRVFGEAGFRSSDIKLSVLQPPPPFSRFCPPLFLYNITDSDPNSHRFNFPFPGFDTIDENSKRIGEILIKKKGNKRNPLLIGPCANEALSNFTERVKTGEPGVVPPEIESLRVISLEKELTDGSREGIDLKLKELGDLLGNCSGPGVVVSIGDFRVLIGDEGGLSDEIRCMVSKLSELMEIYEVRLWLIGAVRSYDIYMKILAQFPSMERDWDLQVLPITSSTPVSSKSSLMGSFVPLGGFFPSPSEFSSQMSYVTQPARSVVCNKQYGNEVLATTLSEGSGASNPHDYAAKYDGTMTNTSANGLPSKWNDICHRHPSKPLSPDIPKTVSQFAGNSNFTVNSNQTSSNDSFSNQSGHPYTVTSSPVDQQRATVPKPTVSYPVVSEASDAKSAIGIHQTSPSSVTSVTTELVLGTTFAKKESETLKFEDQESHLQCFSGTVMAEPDRFGKNTLLSSKSVCSPSLCSGDIKDFKSIYAMLIEKVGRQSEAIASISEAISRCKAGLGRPRGQRQNIWLNFIGHDKVGKRRVAQALAGVVFGNKGSIISVDLGSENGMRCSNSVFGVQDLNSYDGKCWGKTGVDCLVDELSKNPHSVVLLENVDKTDFLAQNSLSQAIRTGRLANSHRREISINNAIFLTTMGASKIFKESSCKHNNVQFSEERILGAKCRQMQILVRRIHEEATKTDAMDLSTAQEKGIRSSKKRKFIDMNESIGQEQTLDLPKRAPKEPNIILDLNLPVDYLEDIDCHRASESDMDSECSKAWLEEFFNQADENVVFKPFDFNALYEEVLKEIDRKFESTVGSNVVLEIDEEVMVQILAATWLSDKKMAVQTWVHHVLGRGFAEAKERYDNLNVPAIMKLVACEGVSVEGQAPGIYLPSRITVN